MADVKGTNENQTGHGWEDDEVSEFALYMTTTEHDNNNQ